MVSDKFRHQLRDEAQSWQADGLISPGQYQQLADRYRFQALDTESRNQFVMILLSLGGVLLGLAVITFVAANWQAWSREFKVVLLLGLFISVNAAGFYLWRSSGLDSPTWRQRLGHGLLLLGTLILGANLALMGQLFHQSGAAYGLFLLWGLGVWLMSFSLRLTSLGVLSVALIGVGYWLGIVELGQAELRSQWLWLIQCMPLIASILFLPLAYRNQSRWIFGCGAIAIVTSLSVIITDLTLVLDSTSGWVLALVFGLPPLLLWGYDDGIWQRFRPGGQEVEPSFRPVARMLAVVILAIDFYGLSYHQSWPAPEASLSLVAQGRQIAEADWPVSLGILIAGFLVFTLAEWLWLGWLPRRRQWRLDQTSAVLLVLNGVAGLMLIWHWQIDAIQVLATFMLNLLLFLLAVGLMREGLGEGKRRIFWSGMLLLVLQIVSRMLEYSTGLLFKAFVFGLCGLGIILVGLWFERYVRNFNSNGQRSGPTALPEGEG
jgi:uncharacterized membrane protein